MYGELANVKRLLEIPQSETTYDTTLEYLLDIANVWLSTRESVPLDDDIKNVACEFFAAYLYRARAEMLSPSGEISGIASEYKKTAFALLEDGIKQETKDRDFAFKKVNKLRG